MLASMNTKGVGAALGFNQMRGVGGTVMVIQRDLNAAILAFQERHEVSGLVEIAATLHAYGNLTDTEYTQIMEALDGENEDGKFKHYEP